MACGIAGVTALACVPGAIPTEDRAAHFALARKLFTEMAQERCELQQHGYAFRFHPEALEELARFVANERRCCPFMKFEITLAAAAGPLWLRMTGPAGTRAVLDAELNLSGSCSCK